MEVTALKKEIHAYIDTMPERKLRALKPLLSVLTDPPYTIETDLSDEEIAMIEERIHDEPENWVALEDLP